MTKIKTGTKTKSGRAQSSGLKWWYASRRDANKSSRGQSAAGATAANPAPEQASFLPELPKPSTKLQPLMKRMPAPYGLMSTASPTPFLQPSSPLLDTFGRPLHRHRDAVRAVSRIAGRKVEARQQRGKMFLWPLLDGGIDLIDARTFDWQAHTESFHQGSAITVYVATRDSICELGSRARLPIAKIGVSERLDLNERMGELNGIGYANIARDALGACRIEDGFDDWHPLRLTSSARPEGDSPVEWSPARLLVSLPASLDAEDFDQLLKSALAHAAILDWSQTEDGLLHCARTGINPRILQRFSAYPQDSGDLRLSAAEELYCFRSAHDPAILVRIIETIIARHLIEERDKASALAAHAANANSAHANPAQAKPASAQSTSAKSASAHGSIGSDQTGLSSSTPPQAWPLFWSMTVKVSS